MIKAQCIGFLKTPPLWENEQFGIQQFEFPDLDLQLFEAKSIPGNIRLGHQVEYVFKQLVEYSETYDLVLHNLQISEGKSTLGEIDFVLKDKARKQLIHVELTYKFYLVNPEISEPIHQIIGPNKRDVFFAKMEKIKQVQFPLLHSDAGARALADHEINHSEIEHQCCFKAQLFYPYGSSHLDIGLLNNNCFTGYWLRWDMFNGGEFADAHFYMPTKSEWVIEPHDQVVWTSHVEFLKEVRLSLTQEFAPMVWLKNGDGEIEKIFVVWW